MKLRALSFAVAACVGLSLHGSTLAQGIPCSYEVAHVIQAPDGPFGSSPTSATAISPNGRYVCGFFNPGGLGFDRAFVFDTQTTEFRVLPLPAGGYQSYCNDVNDAGLAVGSYWVSGGVQPQRGFVYDIAAAQYVAELLPLPGASWCEATGINSTGIVCGYRSIGSKGDPVNPQTAFIWSEKDGFTDLGLIDGRSTTARDINSGGVASVSTGFSSTPGALAYLWHSDGTLEPIGPVPGGLTSSAGRLNDHGWVTIGGMIQQQPLQLATFVRRTDGMFVELRPLRGGFSSGLLSLTPSGVVAGHTNFNTPNNYRRATIWRNAQPMEVRTVLIGPFTGVLESARISDNDLMVVDGEDAAGDVVAFLLTPIPTIIGDVNCDRLVNIDDLLETISLWGPCAGCNPDLTRDGVVNVFDLVEVLFNWGGVTGGAP